MQWREVTVDPALAASSAGSASGGCGADVAVPRHRILMLSRLLPVQGAGDGLAELIPRAVVAMAALSIYLRRRGSLESKPVGALHAATGQED